MRLLQRVQDGRLGLTEDMDEIEAPPYAILSHTWGAEAEEVTFEDILSGAGRTKAGYRKIEFCEKQAEKDGLQYFWIDTCCINKANKAELSRNIRSMFRLYKDALRCYVYLSDVSSASSPGGAIDQSVWESEFRNSKWLTRGWTLQELLAPDQVEFFTYDGVKLGDRTTLARQIYESTNIQYSALQGTPLSQFSIEERLRWRENRQTKLAEDGAYSMSGIFNVDLAPVYGEGSEQAFRRLHDEIRKSEQCMHDLRLTNPYDDKRRIEETKGGLLKDAYFWVLDNPSFQQWCSDPNSHLLWIKGDPGKGKTMLLCGIINELQKTAGRTITISYFICQATDSRINTAVAVLRGLLYMLLDQQPLLISHVRNKYDRAGKSLFEDANAWAALTEIFEDILRDPSLRTTYLVVDALDECITELSKLLDFLVKHSSASSRVKWIVSSRNWPDIEEQLEIVGDKVRLSLELNAESVAAAVNIFIERKVDQLAQEKQYKAAMRQTVLQYLTSNANDTFLWVALVCQGLRRIHKWNVLKTLALFPPGLDSLYKRMMLQISQSDSAEICLPLLASSTALYRPVTIAEVVVLVEQLEDFVDDLESVRKIIGLCGSFLTLREDSIYFVHQSAKDFLLDNVAKEIFPAGREVIHHSLFARSLQVLSETLHRDMYGVNEPGYSMEDVQQPNPDPLAISRYSCVYWIDHLQDTYVWSPLLYPEDLQDGGVVDTFIREKFLYWLEGLSLCKSLSRGVVLIAKLQSIVKKQGQATRLIKLLYDALRFVMYHKVAIEHSPLQTYTSALLFSPTNSLIRQLFQHEAPKDIFIKSGMQKNWSACLQTLEGHINWVTSVAFSWDSTRLASASRDMTVKVWDADSGACLQTLKGHSDWINSLAFSHDPTRLVSGSTDRTVKVWDANSGACLQTLEGHSDWVNSVAFSRDSKRLASGSSDNTVKIWDADSGACLQTLSGHNLSVYSVTFSCDSTRLASGSSDNTVKIWDVDNGVCLQSLEGHIDSVYSVAFSHDSKRLASGSWDMTIKIWDADSGPCLQTLEGHSDSITSVAFSRDSTRLVSGSWDKTVKIWDADSGMCLQTLEGHRHWVTSVAFSHDSTSLASASRDKTVKTWDADSSACLEMLEGHSDSVALVTFFRDSTRLASGSWDMSIKIWDTNNGTCLQTLEGHRHAITSVAFSSDSTRLASASRDKTVKIWDADNGVCLRTLEGHGQFVTSVAFSYDSTRLASGSWDRTVKIWDADSGACLQTLKGHSDWVVSVAFSCDSTRLASGSSGSAVRIWDINSGACLQTLEGESNWVNSVAFSQDSKRLASGSGDRTVKIWDVDSGACLQTLIVSRSVNTVSFDSTEFCLNTNVGLLYLGESRELDTTAVQTDHTQFVGVGISTESTWITFDERKMLWIPSEYRGTCSNTSKTHVGIGVGSGRVWICTIDRK